MIPVAAGEEVAPKLVRLLYFVGAGVICTAAINKWKELERKALIQKEEQQLNQPPLDNPSTSQFTTLLSQITMDSSSNLHNQFHSCFNDWIDQQNRDLHELVAADISDGAQTKRLVEKGVQHFEDYCGKRAVMAQHDATSLMSPAWCTSLENAALWVGGCRPSLSIRLVYSVCGSELDEQLEEFLRGVRKGNLAEISGQQLHMINALHCRIVKEEDKISARIATLQEEIADKPLAVIAKGAERVGEWSRDVERAANAHSLSLAGILVEADRLRLSTFKELMAILTPSQALDLLIATKKLHISMHEWGKTRDCHFGKTTISPP